MSRSYQPTRTSTNAVGYTRSRSPPATQSRYRSPTRSRSPSNSNSNEVITVVSGNRSYPNMDRAKALDYIADDVAARIRGGKLVLAPEYGINTYKIINNEVGTLERDNLPSSGRSRSPSRTLQSRTGSPSRSRSPPRTLPSRTVSPVRSRTRY